jgi:hypothetical protein
MKDSIASQSNIVFISICTFALIEWPKSSAAILQSATRGQNREAAIATGIAWALQGNASGLPPADPRVNRLEGAAAKHAQKGWLATFAIYALSELGSQTRSPAAHGGF